MDDRYLEALGEAFAALRYFEWKGETAPCFYCGRGVDEDGGSLCEPECPSRYSHTILMKYGDLAIRCHAGRDGECNWKDCPQERDGEPERSHRHCPFDKFDSGEL